MLRQSEAKEKFCVIVKNRYGHQCQYSWVAVSLIQYNAIPRELADDAYTVIAEETTRYGTETERMCGANRKKTCACQGLDNFNGASYTFGCSWSMYVNCCKFCRSKGNPRKFKLEKCSKRVEEDLENICHKLSDCVTPAFATLAPDCYNNMCLFENVAEGCRIGNKEFGRPFSGITMVCDYCAHSHKDTNNMVGGCTVVLTLTKQENRSERYPEDEQFHVLPQYVPDVSENDLKQEVDAGGLEVLTKFVRNITIRDEPKKAQGCKRGKPNAEKKKLLDGYVPKDWNAASPKKAESTPKTPRKVVKTVTPKKPNIRTPKKATAKVTKQLDLEQEQNVSNMEAKEASNEEKSYNPPENWNYNFGEPFNQTNISQTIRQLKPVQPITEVNLPQANTQLNQPPPIYQLNPSQTAKLLNHAQRIKQVNHQPVIKQLNHQHTVAQLNQQPTDNHQNPPQAPYQRTITLSNPIIYRSTNHHPVSAAPYIPNVPKIQQPQYYNTPQPQYAQSQPQYHPQPHQQQPQYYQPAPVYNYQYPVTTQYSQNHSPYNIIRHMENQFSDEMMQLLETPQSYHHHPHQSQQMYHHQPQQAQYGGYNNYLPQLDGILDPPESNSAADIYIGYSNRLQELGQNQSINGQNFQSINSRNQQHSGLMNQQNNQNIVTNNQQSHKTLLIHQKMPSNGYQSSHSEKNIQQNDYSEMWNHQNQRIFQYSHTTENKQPSNLTTSRLENQDQAFEENYYQTHLINGNSSVNHTLPGSNSPESNQQPRENGNSVHINIDQHHQNKIANLGGFINGESSEDIKNNIHSVEMKKEEPETKEELKIETEILDSGIKYESEVPVDNVKVEAKEEVKEEKSSIVQQYESDCLEAFQDPDMGGIALALPHGSILVEVAKNELHATTALKRPNRHNPCRIGLVFYQHKNLHFPNHGYKEYVRKTEIREYRDYISWLSGQFVPTSCKLSNMKKAGFEFPDSVKTIKSQEESKEEDRFHPEEFPGFIPGKIVDGKFYEIDPKNDLTYENFKNKMNMKEVTLSHNQNINMEASLEANYDNFNDQDINSEVNFINFQSNQESSYQSFNVE